MPGKSQSNFFDQLSEVCKSDTNQDSSACSCLVLFLSPQSLVLIPIPAFLTSSNVILPGNPAPARHLSSNNA